MKAVVLAGGYATRLWPITLDRPKMLLPLGEGTVISRLIEELEADERIDEVFVSVNERFAQAFEAFVAGGEYSTVRVSVERTRSEREKIGVIGALSQLVDREGIDDDLLVVAGDNLLGFPIADFLDAYDARDGLTVATYDVGSRERATKYGVVELEDDRIVGFEEKPAEPASTLVAIACYGFPAETVAFDSYLDEGNDPDEIGRFIRWVSERRPVYAYRFSEAWYDIGSAESYLDAVSWTLDGETYVHPGATVENTDLTENVHVMDGAHIVDSTVHNSVVFPEARIEGSEIDRSVIDSRASISGVDLDAALVGAYTKLRRDRDE